MECPKCGNQQPDGLEECQRCSVIFAKFRAMQEREARYQEPSHDHQDSEHGGYRDDLPPADDRSLSSEPDDGNPAWASHPLVYLALAMLFGWGAMHFHGALTQMELEGGSMEIHWFFAFLYNVFGKWGVVLPFIALCGVMVVGGLQQAIERLR